MKSDQNLFKSNQKFLQKNIFSNNCWQALISNVFQFIKHPKGIKIEPPPSISTIYPLI